MRHLTILLILGALGFLQLASGWNSNGWYSRGYHYKNVPKFTPRQTWNRYYNSTYIYGRREEAVRIMHTARVSHSDYDIRQYMSGKTSTTHMRYGFVGKVTIDANFPQTTQEFDCTISYIEVHNLSRTGGFVGITRGGIGYRFVSFHFESNINCSLDFSVRIYGACEPYRPPC